MRQVKPAQLISVSPIVTFSLIAFLIALADAVMSYLIPITIEDSLKDTALVGIVISISSFFGMFLDFYATQRWGDKDFKFFMSRVFIYAALFPLIILFLPHKVFYFAIAMVIWSIYYELVGYSKYNFVHKYTALHDHTSAWATLATFGSIAYMLGPGIAAYLLTKYANLPLIMVLVLVTLSSFLYFIFTKKILTKKDRTLTSPHPHQFFKELKILKTLSKRLWVLIVFVSVITMIDVLMWTSGVLYADELSRQTSLGNWFLVIYGIPALFIGIITSKLKGDGKKRTAFTSAAIAGICLLFLGFSKNIYEILIFVFLMSVFYGISAILMDATFEDYIARVEGEGNDIISMLQFFINVSYVIGPILFGFLTKYFGFDRTFVIVGGLVIVATFFCFTFTPRKIKMPQTELKKI